VATCHRASTRVPRCTGSSPGGICLCSTGTCISHFRSHRADSNILLFVHFITTETRKGYFFLPMKVVFNKPAHLLSLLAASQAKSYRLSFRVTNSTGTIYSVSDTSSFTTRCVTLVGPTGFISTTERPHSPLVHSTWACHRKFPFELH